MEMTPGELRYLMPNAWPPPEPAKPSLGERLRSAWWCFQRCDELTSLRHEARVRAFFLQQQLPDHPVSWLEIVVDDVLGKHRPRP